MKPVTWRDYQPIALDFLRRTPRANLFAFMGAGKSLIVETLVQELQTQECTLVLGPLRVARKVWGDEAKEWDHLKGLVVSPVVGDVAQREAGLARRAHIHTMNYENIEWLLSVIPANRWPFSLVVADESTRLKGYRMKQGGKRAAAFATIARRTTRWINLTGTPSSNTLTDLWGQQWFVDHGEALGLSYAAFLRRWFYRLPGGGAYSPLLPHAFTEDEITTRMRPTTMSLCAEDWLPIDKPVLTTVRVELPPAARKEYQRMAKEFVAHLQDGTITAANAGVKSVKLLQLASGAVYKNDGSWAPVHDEKIDALLSIIIEACGEPVLVAYAFVHEAERILARVPGARLIKTERDEDAWNAGKTSVGVIHPASAGHGLNLQHGGRRLVYFGHTWNLEWTQQVLERIGPVRQYQSGYKRTVLVYNIVADSTLDEAVMQRNAGKASMQEALMQSLKATAI